MVSVRPVGSRIAASAASALASLTQGHPRLPESPEHDEVVERFIQYDIGRLKGEAAAQALRDFNRLGQNAIPALVRGLNRSASIHASCPVCVLSSRLQSTLAQSQDPGMFAYTLANIGRDVPETAPHYGRLMDLLKSLNESAENLISSLKSPDPKLRLQAMEQLLAQHDALRPHARQQAAEALIQMLQDDPATRLAAHRLLVVLSQEAEGTPSEDLLAFDAFQTTRQWQHHWRRTGHLEELRRAQTHILVDALRAPDAARCQGAAAAIGAHPSRFGDGQKVQLARSLIELLSAGNADDRAYAGRALTALAGQGSGRDWPADKWSDFWDTVEIDKLIGPRANAYLGMAERLDARGQYREAADRYRKIVGDYPHTPAAAKARQRLAQLAKE